MSVIGAVLFIIFCQPINLFASDHMAPYHNKRKDEKIIKIKR